MKSQVFKNNQFPIDSSLGRIHSELAKPVDQVTVDDLDGSNGRFTTYQDYEDGMVLSDDRLDFQAVSNFSGGSGQGGGRWITDYTIGLNDEIEYEISGKFFLTSYDNQDLVLLTGLRVGSGDQMKAGLMFKSGDSSAGTATFAIGHTDAQFSFNEGKSVQIDYDDSVQHPKVFDYTVRVLADSSSFRAVISIDGEELILEEKSHTLQDPSVATQFMSLFEARFSAFDYRELPRMKFLPCDSWSGRPQFYRNSSGSSQFEVDPAYAGNFQYRLIEAGREDTTYTCEIVRVVDKEMGGDLDYQFLRSIDVEYEDNITDVLVCRDKAKPGENNQGNIEMPMDCICDGTDSLAGSPFSPTVHVEKSGPVRDTRYSIESNDGNKYGCNIDPQQILKRSELSFSNRQVVRTRTKTLGDGSLVLYGLHTDKWKFGTEGYNLRVTIDPPRGVTYSNWSGGEIAVYDQTRDTYVDNWEGIKQFPSTGSDTVVLSGLNAGSYIVELFNIRCSVVFDSEQLVVGDTDSYASVSDTSNPEERASTKLFFDLSPRDGDAFFVRWDPCEDVIQSDSVQGIPINNRSVSVVENFESDPILIVPSGETKFDFHIFDVSAGSFSDTNLMRVQNDDERLPNNWGIHAFDFVNNQNGELTLIFSAYRDHTSNTEYRGLRQDGQFKPEQDIQSAPSLVRGLYILNIKNPVRNANVVIDTYELNRVNFKSLESLYILGDDFFNGGGKHDETWYHYDDEANDPFLVEFLQESISAGYIDAHYDDQRGEVVCATLSDRRRQPTVFTGSGNLWEERAFVPHFEMVNSHSKSVWVDYSGEDITPTRYSHYTNIYGFSACFGADGNMYTMASRIPAFSDSDCMINEHTCELGVLPPNSNGPLVRARNGQDVLDGVYDGQEQFETMPVTNASLPDFAVDMDEGFMDCSIDRYRSRLIITQSSFSALDYVPVWQLFTPSQIPFETPLVENHFTGMSHDFSEINATQQSPYVTRLKDGFDNSGTIERSSIVRQDFHPEQSLGNRVKAVVEPIGSFQNLCKLECQLGAKRTTFDGDYIQEFFAVDINVLIDQNSVTLNANGTTEGSVDVSGEDGPFEIDVLFRQMSIDGNVVGSTALVVKKSDRYKVGVDNMGVLEEVGTVGPITVYPTTVTGNFEQSIELGFVNPSSANSNYLDVHEFGWGTLEAVPGVQARSQNIAGTDRFPFGYYTFEGDRVRDWDDTILLEREMDYDNSYFEVGKANIRESHTIHWPGYEFGVEGQRGVKGDVYNVGKKELTRRSDRAGELLHSIFTGPEDQNFIVWMEDGGDDIPFDASIVTGANFPKADVVARNSDAESWTKIDEMNNTEFVVEPENYALVASEDRIAIRFDGAEFYEGWEDEYIYVDHPNTGGVQAHRVLTQTDNCLIVENTDGSYKADPATIRYDRNLDIVYESGGTQTDHDVDIETGCVRIETDETLTEPFVYASLDDSKPIRVFTGRSFNLYDEVKRWKQVGLRFDYSRTAEGYIRFLKFDVGVRTQFPVTSNPDYGSGLNLDFEGDLEYIYDDGPYMNNNEGLTKLYEFEYSLENARDYIRMRSLVEELGFSERYFWLFFNESEVDLSVLVDSWDRTLTLDDESELYQMNLSAKVVGE